MKTKLVTCKTCGKEIAKSANVCPQCGAKQHQVAYAFCVVIGILAVIACVAVVVSGLSGGGDSQTTPQESAIEISAKDLWTAYEENKVNADSLYKDKLLSVTGTISDISQDIVSKNPCIMLNTGTAMGLYDIQCFFTNAEEETEQLAALKDGQTITITGKCTGTPVMNVQLTDCHLSE